MSPLEAKWRSLHADSTRPVFQLVDAAHPLDLYIGRDPNGVPLLLLIVGDRPDSPRQMRNIRIEVHAREDGKWGLLVRLLAEELEQLFILLCADLVEATRSARRSQAGTAVLQQLSRWQYLLERSRTGLLSPQEVRGLFAELSVLKDMAVERYGVAQAVAAWQGPSGAHQDFSLPDARWEVKAIRVGAGTVRIASEHQLESAATSLVLIVIELQESLDPMPAAASLNGMVAEIRTLFGNVSDARDAFERCLADAGYLTRSEYDTPFFSAVSNRFFDVREGFPRIVRSTTPLGVCGVEYEVIISACSTFEIPAREWRR